LAPPLDRVVGVGVTPDLVDAGGKGGMMGVAMVFVRLVFELEIVVVQRNPLGLQLGFKLL
jgi:hypothetical protein